MKIKELVLREEQANERVNWIITGGFIGTAAGFIIFSGLAIANLFVPGMIIQGVLVAAGLIAGIPLQFMKR